MASAIEFRILADARKRPLRFLHAHPGQRAHGAYDVLQLAHAGDVPLDIGEAGHGPASADAAGDAVSECAKLVSAAFSRAWNSSGSEAA